MNAINVATSLNKLPLRDILLASPALLAARNSKGRITPMHLVSAPGMGKTQLTGTVAETQARMNPGEPYGVRTFNVQTASPTDLSIILFDDVTHPEGHPYAGRTDRVSRFTLPAVFELHYVLFADPTATDPSRAKVLRVTRDIAGQPLFPGSLVRCPFTGSTHAVIDGMIFLDEFMQGDAEVRKALAPLLDEGRIGSFTLPPGFAVWLASNRAKDASGVGKALAFLTNREARIEVGFDVGALRSYGRGHNGLDTINVGLDDLIYPSRSPLYRLVDNGDGAQEWQWTRRPWHPAFMAYIENNASNLDAGVPADPSTPFLTPRSLEAVANLFDTLLCIELDADGKPVDSMIDNESRAMELSVVKFDDDENQGAARWRVFMAVASGMIGSDNAAELRTTIDLFRETPSLEEMIADPAKCHVSDKKDAQIICAWKIVDGITPRNGVALLRYAERLNSAFFSNIIINAVARDSQLLLLPPIARFQADNPDVMFRMLHAQHMAAGAGKRQRRSKAA